MYIMLNRVGNRIHILAGNSTAGVFIGFALMRLMQCGQALMRSAVSAGIDASNTSCELL